jgi:DNA segregation ATPase FtsK/SpoIIIE, S-DNA-T family
MARRKKLFKFPFKFKIKNKTFVNIVGFLLVVAALLLIMSFFNFLGEESGGTYLTKVHTMLTDRFSFLAIFVPFILLLLSTHFFKTRKTKFVKAHVTIGLILVYAALMGVFRAGSWGDLMYVNLSTDFSGGGAILILIVTFIIGLVLFLDTSVDAFVIFIAKLSKALVLFVKNHLFREVLSMKKNGAGLKMEHKNDGKEDLFIANERKSATPEPLHKPAPVMQKPVMVHHPEEKGMIVRPLSGAGSTWVYPPISMLADVAQQSADRGDVKQNADTIEKTLESFGIRARVDEVNNGPTVTQYALEIARGTKLTKITALGGDLALALAAPTGQVRIEAPIPGRSLVGIEIPNNRPEIVTLKRMLNSAVFKNSADPLLVPLGLDVSGQPTATSIGKMPHSLIAGTTGSGKSVMLNAWISTLLFRTKPEELRMILVDPKRVELTVYNGIPHLLTEVIVEPDKIVKALNWTIGEMMTRYKDFSKAGVRNLDGYNALPGIEKKPYIVFVIDELADLMIFAAREAEELITRLAQMARATGIHLILATQRPSVDVITGLMKANIPTRVAFNVSSLVDSRVIIDMPGAEKLLGKGDMLFLPPEQAKPRRIQGPFITEKEVHDLVSFLKSQSPPVHYTEEITEVESVTVGGRTIGKVGGGGSDDHDSKFNEALELIGQMDKASASLLQRKLAIGYARAARLLDQLEEAGYVGPGAGSKPRDVIRRQVQETEMPEQ